MPESYGELVVHLVWRTYERLPLLTQEIRPAVYSCIQDQCADLSAGVVALGGTEDHVHLLVQLPSSLSVAVLAKRVKGASSHLVRYVLGVGEFQWQEGYGAFSVSRWDVSKIRDYVYRQAEHHAEQTLKPALEPR